MNYNVYTKGNIFFIKDEEGILYRAHSKDVLITNYKNSNLYYYFHHVLDWDASITVKRAEILKEDGSAYTDEEWFVFQTESIGGNSNGGGNGMGLQAYDQANSFKLNAVVINNDKIYIANDTIPENTPFATGTSGATWREISKVSELTTRGSFNTYAILVANVTNPQEDDLAVVETTTGIRFISQRLKGLWRYNGIEWTFLGSVPTKHGAPLYYATQDYYIGNLIYHNDTLQRANKDFSAKAFDQADWDSVGGSFWQATYSETTASYVYYAGINGSAWQVNRKDRNNNMVQTTATQTNNTTITTLADAVTGILTLNY